jgi:hypothetical protein
VTVSLPTDTEIQALLALTWLIAAVELAADHAPTVVIHAAAASVADRRDRPGTILMAETP